MNQYPYQQKSVNGKDAIATLSIIALSLRFLVSIIRMAEYGSYAYSGWGYITLMTGIASMVLLIVYVFAGNKLGVMVPIIFGLTGFQYFVLAIQYMTGTTIDIIVSFILYIPMTVFCILALVSALKGLNKKGFPLTVVWCELSFGFIMFISYMVSMVTYGGINMAFGIQIVDWAWNGCFDIALLLLVTKNTIPAMVGADKGNYQYTQQQQFAQQNQQFGQYQQNQQYDQQNQQYGQYQQNQQYDQQNQQYGQYQQYGQQNQQYGQYQQNSQQYGQYQQNGQNPQYGQYGQVTPAQELMDLDEKYRMGLISPEEYQFRRDQILRKF